MSQPTPPEGFLGTIINDLTGLDVRDLVPDLPGPIGDAINSTVDVILGPDGPNIGDPQPEGERPIPTTDPQELNAAVRSIDIVLGAINVVLGFKLLIPNNIEDVLRKLAGALSTIRGWLD